MSPVAATVVAISEDATKRKETDRNEDEGLHTSTKNFYYFGGPGIL